MFFKCVSPVLYTPEVAATATGKKELSTLNAVTRLSAVVISAPRNWGGVRSGLRSEVQCLVRSNKLEVNSDCRTYESTFWCGFGNEFNARPSYVIEGKAMIRNLFPRLITNWLPCMDSNHDKMIQNHFLFFHKLTFAFNLF